MDHTLMDSLMSGVIGAAAGAVLVSPSANMRLMGMNVNVPLGVGAVVAASDYIAESVKRPVLQAWGWDSPSAEMSVPLAASGLATYGLLRVGVSNNVRFLPTFALGAGSSYAGPMVRSAIGL